MKFNIKTPADWRASTCAALIGSGIGLALGAAYMAGGMASAATDHARASRLALSVADGFSESALQRQAAVFDPGVLSIVRRHDTFTMAGDADRGRQSADLAARLDARAGQPGKISATFAQPAAPFRISGALDSSRELECLTQAVYFEARGETPAGQAAVAQVVLNRVRHPAFPKSVCSVVYQGAARASGCQFSFACDGSMRKGRESGAWDRAQRVATKALSGSVMASVGDATHFHTTNVAPNWGPRLARTAQVGLHVFYRLGRDAGRTYVAQREAGAETYAKFTAAPVAAAPMEVASDFRLSSALTETPAEPEAGLTADTKAEAPTSAPVKATPTSAAMTPKPTVATPS